MRVWFGAIAFALAAAAIPVAAQADGELRASYADGTSKVYPGLEVVDTSDALYLVDVSAHQMLIVLKSKCAKEGTLDRCTGTSVSWDRYGVRTDLDASQVSFYFNGTQKAAGIKSTPYTLTPNSLMLDIVTAKGAHLTAMGYVDSTNTP